jgi:hypothetical protein
MDKFQENNSTDYETVSFCEQSVMATLRQMSRDHSTDLSLLSHADTLYIDLHRAGNKLNCSKSLKLKWPIPCSRIHIQLCKSNG